MNVKKFSVFRFSRSFINLVRPTYTFGFSVLVDSGLVCACAFLGDLSLSKPKNVELIFRKGYVSVISSFTLHTSPASGTHICGRAAPVGGVARPVLCELGGGGGALQRVSRRVLQVAGRLGGQVSGQRQGRLQRRRVGRQAEVERVGRDGLHRRGEDAARRQSLHARVRRRQRRHQQVARVRRRGRSGEGEGRRAERRVGGRVLTRRRHALGVIGGLFGGVRHDGGAAEHYLTCRSPTADTICPKFNEVTRHYAERRQTAG